MTKAEEILEKHLKNNLDQRLYLRSSRLTYNLCLDALNEAINYTHCCEELCDESKQLEEEFEIHHLINDTYQVVGKDSNTVWKQGTLEDCNEFVML